MASSIYGVADDKDFDDAALWAVIDSAAAASAAALSKSRKPLTITYQKTSNSPAPLPRISGSSPPVRTPKNARPCYSEFESNLAGEGEVLQEPWVFRPPRKVGRTSSSEIVEVSPMSVVKFGKQQPGAMSYSSPEKYLSPEIGRFPGSECSPASCKKIQEKESPSHCLSGMFPSVSLFKEYQDAAMAILEKSDFTMISGNPFIKKSGWRKISFYFNVSYEIKDKSIEFDEQRNVQRAEFVVRAYMQGGRFSDGWGSCERREKRFQKPNHDIPSTAETRAKNRACQDLLGIGEYRPGMAQVNGQR